MQSKNAHHIDHLERDQLGLGFAFGLALVCWLVIGAIVWAVI